MGWRAGVENGKKLAGGQDPTSHKINDYRTPHLTPRLSLRPSTPGAAMTPPENTVSVSETGRHSANRPPPPHAGSP
jgi:hypothetical protein